MLASNVDRKNPQLPLMKTGRMAGLSVSSPTAILPQNSLAYTLNPQVKTLIDAWVEYNRVTCTLISSGSWTVTTAPTYGKTATGIITGTLGNGDCPGVTFPFAAIYYTWTSKDPNGVSSDSFAATWTSPDFQVQDNVAITLIVPINFQQMGPGVAMPGGVLHFN